MPCRQRCKECSNSLTHQINYKEKPALLVLEYPGTNIKSSYKIKIKIGNKYKVLSLYFRQPPTPPLPLDRVISPTGKIALTRA